MPDRIQELEQALRLSRETGIRLWQNADHWQSTLKEIKQLTNDPIIIHLAEQALLFNSHTL